MREERRKEVARLSLSPARALPLGAFVAGYPRELMKQAVEVEAVIALLSERKVRLRRVARRLAAQP